MNGKKYGVMWKKLEWLTLGTNTRLLLSR